MPLPAHRLAGHTVTASRVAALMLVAVLSATCSCSAAPRPVDGLTALAPINRQAVPVADEARVHRGEIVVVDDHAQYAADLLNASASVKRAVYRSTSGVTGQPVQVAGIFAVPKGTPPSGGWPVVSVGHGTTGIEHGCGPSRQPDLMGYQSTVTGLLSAGFAVAMSDYQGLDDVGVHAYLEPRSAAYDVIDAVRALGRLFPDVSTRWAAFGGSQGGQAAWAANELNSEYGQDLQLVGTVALAPPANIAAMAELAYRNQLSAEQQAAFPLVIVGLERAGLLATSTPYLRGAAKPTEPDILGCGAVATRKRSSLRSEDVGPDSDAAAEDLQRALREIALPQQPLSAPMAVINGSRDEIVLPAWVEFAVESSCRLGGDIQHVELSEADHSGGFPYGDIEQWLTDRFANRPTASTCSE